MDEFPGNSRSAKITPTTHTVLPSPEEVTLEKVVTGKVIKRRKPLGRRLKETFFSGSSESVFGYLLTDVMVPAFQSIVIDVITQGIQRAVYGNDARQPQSGGYRGPGSTPAGRPMVSYHQASSTRPSYGTNRRPSTTPVAYEVGDVIVDSHIEAQTIAGQLYDTVEKYGATTVSHLNELLGQTSVFTDNKYGWYDLSAMSIRRVREGYLILLPPVEVMKP